jgi:ABC-type multidrug transport system fused ATPase/permease subunit
LKTCKMPTCTNITQHWLCAFLAMVYIGVTAFLTGYGAVYLRSCSLAIQHFAAEKIVDHAYVIRYKDSEGSRECFMTTQKDFVPHIIFTYRYDRSHCCDSKQGNYQMGILLITLDIIAFIGLFVCTFGWVLYHKRQAQALVQEVQSQRPEPTTEAAAAYIEMRCTGDIVLRRSQNIALGIDENSHENISVVVVVQPA